MFLGDFEVGFEFFLKKILLYPFLSKEDRHRLGDLPELFRVTALVRMMLKHHFPVPFLYLGLRKKRGQCSRVVCVISLLFRSATSYKHFNINI